MHIILKLFFSLPLFFVHTLGCILGLFIYLFDAKFRHRISNNLSKAKLNSLNKNNKLIISNTMHVGMTLLESFVIWFASPEKIRSMVKKTINWNLVNKLTIVYNRSRQASITKELIEIISGAESL